MKKYFILVILPFILYSCNQDKKAAQARLAEAQGLYESFQYGSAKIILDEIKANYPKELEIQKEGLYLMRKIELNEQERNLLFCDSMILVRKAEADSMKQFFLFEKTAYDNAGRYIDKDYNPQIGYAPRYLKINVNEQAEIALSSVYSGQAIHHNQIKVNAPSGEYAETEVIPNDGGANYSFKDINGTTHETVTYQKGRDNGVVRFIYTYAPEKITLEYLGGKKTNPITLSVKAKNAIVRTVDFAGILNDIDKFQEEKEKAEKRIEYLQAKLSK